MYNRPPISSSPPPIPTNFFLKRKKRGGPNFIYIIAGVLVLGGVILLIAWLTGSSKPLNAFFATETPTSTLTFTPTNTLPPTETPLPSSTATITPTATFSTISRYTVQVGDSLFSISEKYNLGDNGIPLILMLNSYSVDPTTGIPIGIDPTTLNLIPGQAINLPYPGMPLPTTTPIPPNLARGTKLEYVVKFGDTLAGIASAYNSTADAIIKENNIKDPNAIQVGQLLIVPANIVTPTATRPPTSTTDPSKLNSTLTVTPIN